MKVFVVVLLLTLALCEGNTCSRNRNTIPPSCKQPRRQIVYVDVDNLKVPYYVKRCDDLTCKETKQKCTATGVKKVKTEVQTVGPDGKLKCRKVEVEEHTECGCKCPENMVLDTYNNACKCTVKSKKCGKNRSWNDVSCACQCNKEGQCSSGYEFDMDKCKCVYIQEYR
ncbi:uncharacterized protein LOC143020578 [Oratosquilla oratoria]|uniref:uncharacterized protein LOC143020578 n=1 Tax=Oratosquilla oratoria TaxID=337810 RepID=UPI003F76301F